MTAGSAEDDLSCLPGAPLSAFGLGAPPRCCCRCCDRVQPSYCDGTAWLSFLCKPPLTGPCPQNQIPSCHQVSAEVTTSPSVSALSTNTHYW